MAVSARDPQHWPTLRQHLLEPLLDAQVGKGSIVDVNTATEKELLALPHMTPAIAKGVLEKRPFGSIVELNAYLSGQSLTPEQLTALYGNVLDEARAADHAYSGVLLTALNGEVCAPSTARTR